MDKHSHHNHNGHTHDISHFSGKKIFWVTILNATITIAELDRCEEKEIFKS